MTGMTKDYAIAILRRMQEPDPYEPQINESAFDALEMAIQALSAQDEDTISRQAALDAIHIYFGSRIENDCPTQLVDGEEIYISTSALNALLAINKALSQAIKELPSCSKMEQVGDCISRQAAIDAIRGWVKKAFEDWGNAETEIRCFNAIYPLIMALPSAQLTQTNTDSTQDCISRQAVIDAIVTWTVEDRPDAGMPTDLVGRINALPSAQPTETSCWGCNCPKMEILKEQKTFSEMVHHHDAETHEERTETHGVCLDTISRRTAIDAVRKEIERVIKELPSAQPESQWIPCSERLPERGKDVLVTRDYDGREDHNKSCRYVEVASCYGEENDITWNSYSDEYKMTPKNHHVIAWMPLPEPYKERREE